MDGKETPSVTINLHIDPTTLIEVKRHPQGISEEHDRVVVQIGPSLRDVNVFLDREDAERLHAILEGELRWFANQAGDRIHATLSPSECLGPECYLHGVGVTKCPECDSVVELTPSGALTCREHGSAHYRVERAAEQTSTSYYCLTHGLSCRGTQDNCELRCDATWTTGERCERIHRHDGPHHGREGLQWPSTAEPVSL